MYEDAGEFIGSIIRAYCPELANYIKDFRRRKRSTTFLFEPVLEENMEVFPIKTNMKNRCL